MGGPIVGAAALAGYIFLKLGRGAKTVYKLADTPAGKELLKKFMGKDNPYGITQVPVSKLPKKFQGGKKLPDNLTQKALKEKDPTIFQEIGGRIKSLFGGKRITKKTSGVNKRKDGASINKERIDAQNIGIGTVGVGVTGATVVGGKVIYDKLKPKPKPKRKSSAELLDRKNITTSRPKPKPKPRIKKKDYSPSGKGIKRITIQKGDNLTTIAKRENTTVSKIMKLNPSIKDRNKIKTGQKIIVRGN